MPCQQCQNDGDGDRDDDRDDRDDRATSSRKCPVSNARMMAIVIVMMIMNVGYKDIVSSRDDYLVPFPLYDISTLQKIGVRQIINWCG